MSTKQMLAILGSPRKGGNLSQMLDHTISIAKEKGYEVHFISLYDQNIAYCKGCMGCKKTGSCCISDDSLIPKPKLSSKQGYLLLTTCSTPAPFDRLAHQSTGCLTAMKEFFKTSGMHHLGNVTYAGTKNKTNVPDKILRKIEKKLP